MRVSGRGGTKFRGKVVMHGAHGPERAKHDVSVDERDEWRPQHEWLIEQLKKLHRAIMHTGVLEDWAIAKSK